MLLQCWSSCCRRVECQRLIHRRREKQDNALADLESVRQDWVVILEVRIEIHRPEVGSVGRAKLRSVLRPVDKKRGRRADSRPDQSVNSHRTHRQIQGDQTESAQHDPAKRNREGGQGPVSMMLRSGMDSPTHLARRIGFQPVHLMAVKPSLTSLEVPTALASRSVAEPAVE